MIGSIVTASRLRQPDSDQAAPAMPKAGPRSSCFASSATATGIGPPTAPNGTCEPWSRTWSPSAKTASAYAPCCAANRRADSVTVTRPAWTRTWRRRSTTTPASPGPRWWNASRSVASRRSGRRRRSGALRRITISSGVPGTPGKRRLPGRHHLQPRPVDAPSGSCPGDQAAVRDWRPRAADHQAGRPGPGARLVGAADRAGAHRPAGGSWLIGSGEAGGIRPGRCPGIRALAGRPGQRPGTRTHRQGPNRSSADQPGQGAFLKDSSRRLGAECRGSTALYRPPALALSRCLARPRQLGLPDLVLQQYFVIFSRVRWPCAG